MIGKFGQIHPVSLTDRVIASLKDAFFSGQLQPGDTIVERQIARTTVVSATYFGSRGVHLPIPSLELNQIDPTNLAQGGIIYKGQEDSPGLLVEDILRAGAGHASRKAATLLAEEGPGLVKRLLLERLGVEFDRVADGALSLALEGGHSLPRIIHAADATGKAISTALVRALQAHPNVTLLVGHTAIDLLTPAHHSLNRLDIYDPLSCVGAYVLDQATGQVKRCMARHIRDRT